MISHNADINGLNTLLFFDPLQTKAWRYTYPSKSTPLLAGGSLCYTRALWRRKPFSEINQGEDTRFVWNKLAKRIMALPKNGFYVALNHEGNTCKRNISGSRWKAVLMDELRELMTGDFDYYVGFSEGKYVTKKAVK